MRLSIQHRADGNPEQVGRHDLKSCPIDIDDLRSSEDLMRDMFHVPSAIRRAESGVKRLQRFPNLESTNCVGVFPPRNPAMPATQA